MNEQKAAQTSTALSLSLKTILTWLGAIVLAVAGGTFALTKLSTSSRVAALQTELEGTKVRLNEKDDAILRLKAAYPGLTERHEVAIKVLPDATLNAAKDDPELSRLADRINDLEKERYALLSNLAKLSQNALDPSSELSNLLSQLSAESEMGRADAVRGLFDLRDHRAFNSLVSYFKSKPEEATRAKTIGEWYRLLFKMDSKAALEFMVQQLESDETLHSEYAYDDLMRKISRLNCSIME